VAKAPRRWRGRIADADDARAAGTGRIDASGRSRGLSGSDRDDEGTLWPTAPTETASGRLRRLIIRTDGAARGNPGPASAGAALIDASRPDARDPRARPDASISEFLGVQTNNVAEYTAVVRALALARELGAREVDLLLDSKLIVEQLAGRWRVKDAKLIPLWETARRTLRSFERWSATHVPRAQNSVADALCNEAIDRVAAGGPPIVVVRPSD
jgi:probable phosphoglycerate mutase